MSQAVYSLSDPTPKFAEIVPSDDTNFGLTPALSLASIYVGGAGIVQAVREDGTVVPFTAPAGAILPIRCVRVNATGTTATLLVRLGGP